MLKTRRVIAPTQICTSVGDPDPDPQIRDPDPHIFTGIQIRKRSAIIFMRISYLRLLNIPLQVTLEVPS